MMKRYFILYALLLSFTLNAQVKDSAVVEKIYLHFDRTLYSAGETIFYKAYLLENNHWNDFSKNLYVDWFDDKGNCIKQTAAPIGLSAAIGSFDIPLGYTANHLYLVAYTQQMLRVNKRDILYQHAIPLVSKSVKQRMEKQERTTVVSLFPEGGDLIEGISSRVAFKAVNQVGAPVSINGVVKTELGEVITSFITEHDGMGTFVMKPLQGQNYFVDWKDDLGNSGLVPITKVRQTGATLTVYQTPEDIKVTIQSMGGVAVATQLKLYVHQNHTILQEKLITVSPNEPARVSIPVNRCRSGILQLTLLNNMNEPLAERIVFVDNEENIFDTKIEAVTKSVEKRAKQKLLVSTKDTTLSNLSITVYDADLALPNDQTILSSFMLTSELKGYIHQPAYYFDDANDKRLDHIDLLMMTHGWRRFTAPTQDAQSIASPDFVGIRGFIDGSLKTANDSAILDLLIVQPDSSFRYERLPVVTNQSFSLPSLPLMDSTKLYFSFDRKVKRSFSGKLNFETGVVRKDWVGQYKFDFPVSNLDDTSQNVVSTLNKAAIFQKNYGTGSLPEVIVRSKVKTRIETLDEQYATGVFKGSASRTFDVVNNKQLGLRNVFYYLQGQIPSLIVDFSTTDTTGASASTIFPTPLLLNSRTRFKPLVFLDQQPILDITVLSGIFINEIAYIKWFDPGFAGGGLGSAGGALAIYTKRGTEEQSKQYRTAGMDMVQLLGYTKFKEFYSPVYSASNNPSRTDTRKTIYWNPNILLYKENNAKEIEFFNNDFSNKLVVVLEGINAEGKLTRTTTVIGQ